MSKLDLNKIKTKYPKMDHFVHRYAIESLTVLAIIIAAFSAWTHLFLGTFGWSLLFLVLGSIAGIFFSEKMDLMIRKVYALPGNKKTSIVIAEIIKIAIALFLPFLYFAFLGILTGTAYQYYIHQIHIGGGKGSKAA